MSVKRQMIKVALLGSSGKMGLVIRQALAKEPGYEKFLEITNQSTNEFKNSFSSLDKVSEPLLKKIDVWIDFSRPEPFMELLKITAKHKTALVSGTTGFSKKQFDEIKKQSLRTSIFWASNMSIGLWTLRQAIKTLKPIAGFDFCLDEIHHTKKIDNPSGTAVTLHADLEKAIGKKVASPIGKRLGGVFGIHTITAASDSEMIKLEHIAMNRSVFAEGALKATAWIVKQKSGLYSMDDLMLNKN